MHSNPAKEFCPILYLPPKYYHLPFVSSTQKYAKEHLSSFPKNRLIVISADIQARGYGRDQKTSIISSTNNLEVSLCLQTQLPPFFFAQLTSLALCDLLSKYSVKALIKWPNDLLIDKEKIGGILIEQKNDFLIIGFLLNINTTQEELEKIDQPATSLCTHTHIQYDLEKVKKECISFFLNRLQENPSTIRSLWKEKIGIEHSNRTIRTKKETFQAAILSIEDDGSVRIMRNNKIETLSYGEIF